MENIKPNEIKKELSPETAEKTMEKVFDIDTKGTAYSNIEGIRPRSLFHDSTEDKKLKIETEWKKMIEKIEKVLQDGLIGISKVDTPLNRNNMIPLKEKYIEHLKDRELTNQLVYANIVGRSEGDDPKISPTEIGNSWWVCDDDFNVSVIFDKDFFEEDEPKWNDSERKLLKDKWKFNADDPDVVLSYKDVKGIESGVKIGDETLKKYGKNYKFGGEGIGFDENGMPHPYQEYGFVFFPRVPKRTFKGLVVKIPKDEMYDQRIQEVADAVIESNLQIPIYDTDGNVVWPKKISFEDIKKLDNEKKQKTEI